ncbi:MAG: ankyrin repeat domain-containing protein [Leucothrix sp.]
MRKTSFAFQCVMGMGLVGLLLSSIATYANEKAICSAYARNSVLAHIENIKSECGFKGALWSPGLHQHQTWCLQKNIVSAKQNSVDRQAQLDRCGRVMQRELTWDELDFRVQNDLFGELIMAVAMDDIDSLKLFESQGVDLTFEWRLIDGGLLYWAISNQATQVVRYLIEQKSANPNLTVNGGPNPLVKLLNHAPDANYRLLAYLLQQGARPNHGGEDYSDASFPLTTASANNDLEAVRLLLKFQANPNLYESIPPLMMAIYQKNSRMVDLLLKSGANPNRGLNRLSCQEIRKQRPTGELLAMDAAISAGNSRIIDALSQRGAKTTAQCLNG